MEYRVAFKSSNNKIRIEIEDKIFIAEELKKGSLVSIFDKNGNLIDQRKYDICAEESLSDCAGNIKIVEAEYKPVNINAVCPKCGKRSIKRELDLVDTKKIENVPAVPIYVCTSCKQAFYSLTKQYLKKLAKEHSELFDEEEKKALENDEEAFTSELNEYIIRIFASKKINKIEIKK
ncbi:MAG: hypothetical protein ACP5RT_01930 [Candidatus Micrarchaeia archaeon]